MVEPTAAKVVRYNRAHYLPNQLLLYLRERERDLEDERLLRLGLSSSSSDESLLLLSSEYFLSSDFLSSLLYVSYPEGQDTFCHSTPMTPWLSRASCGQGCRRNGNMRQHRCPSQGLHGRVWRIY